MKYFIQIINVTAFIAGIYTAVVSYRLDREFRKSHLHNYFYFILFSIIAGFCDWISVNWIKMWIPAIDYGTLEKIYHIFWGIIGFPSSMFALYFLLKSFSEMAGFKISRAILNTFIFFAAVLILLSVVKVSIYTNTANSIIGLFLTFAYSVFLPIIYITFLFYTLYASIENNKFPYLKRFVLIIIVSFSVWYIVTAIQIFAGMGEWAHTIIFVYYMALLVPTLYLKFQLNLNASLLALETIPEERLLHYLEKFEFTEREKEIAGLLYAGKSNKEIEDSLFISHQTVKNYVSKIYKKLSVKSRLEYINLLRNLKD